MKTAANQYESIWKNIGKIKGIKVDRKTYLRESFRIKDKKMQEKIIAEGPVEAGVSIEEISKIADKAILNEALKVTSKSFTAGIPGGIAMFATIPVDLLQTYYHCIRIIQKLMYLYGWDEDIFDNSENMDDETSMAVQMYLGVMLGIKSASTVAVKVAAQSASKAAKGAIGKGAFKAILKNGIYRNILGKTIKTVGVKGTLKGATKIWTKMLPVISGLFSASVTLATVLPGAKKLKKYFETGRVESIETDGIEIDGVEKETEENDTLETDDPSENEEI